MHFFGKVFDKAQSFTNSAHSAVESTCFCFIFLDICVVVQDLNEEGVYFGKLLENGIELIELVFY